jgi:hypothetical protein
MYNCAATNITAAKATVSMALGKCGSLILIASENPSNSKQNANLGR